MIQMKFQTLRWENDRLFFLDQTKLPLEVSEEEQISVDQVWDSIKKLKVRGAPAIGVAAAYGLVIAMKKHLHLSKEDFMSSMHSESDYLNSSRPTAVNLSWALERIKNRVLEEDLSVLTVSRIFEIMKKEAESIHREDIELCQAIGREGMTLIKPGMGVLTHCNAGALATSGIGTATAPMYYAHGSGIDFKVFADETRPLLQGARLTSWELKEAGVDVSLICDNMAASLMSQGLIDLIIVGTDRVAANGDVANKIGTLAVALLAGHYNIPFYVACPSSTIDFNTPNGSEIVIEERDSEEVTSFGERRTGPEGVQVRNPAFDVTPAEFVTGLITEKGIIRAPLDKGLNNLFSR